MFTESRPTGKLLLDVKRRHSIMANDRDTFQQVEEDGQILCRWLGPTSFSHDHIFYNSFTAPV